MQKKKSNKGFTLLELLIALAILAIIAAILIPNFFATTDRARLRSDIQSARVIQSAIELYRAEQGSAPAGDSIEVILQRLVNADFISARDTTPQTQGAEWAQVDNLVMVNISASPTSVHNIYANLSDTERAFVTGGRTGAGAGN